jgi:PAS domain S-box-containing protein
MLGGRHVGNVFIGQFFYEDEPQDMELFRQQARRYGFDEKDYLAALDRVPHFSREKVEAGMQFYAKLAGLISTLSFSAIQQSRLLAEQKRVEEALRTTQDQFDFALKKSHIGAWDLNLADFSSHRTPSHDRIFGYETPLPQWTYEMFLEHVLPEDRPQVDRKFQHATATQTDWDFECRIRHPDGEVRWIWGAGGHYPTAEGKSLRMLGVVQDITERKQAEQILQESERKLREAQKMAKLGHWRWDVKTGDVDWSEEVYKIFQLDPAEFTPRIDSIQELSPWPEDHERDQELIHKAMASHVMGEYEQRFLRPDKSVGYFHSTFQGRYNEQGDLIAIAGTAQDITERKRTEAELRLSNERLLFATEGANLGVWNWDLLTDELVWSDRCKTFFGIPLDEAMTFQRFRDALHPDDREAMDAAVRDALDNHTDYDTEYRAILPDGGIHWLEAKGRGYYDAAGNVVRMEGVLIDIAGRKRDEEQLRAYRDHLEQQVKTRTAQLEAVNKELEAFSYSVSHDLRAPLRAIDGFSHALQEDLGDRLDETCQDHLRRVRAATQRMARLIDDLLKLSRLGKVPLDKQRLDLSALAQGIVEELRAGEPARHVEVLVAENVQTKADPTLLAVVLDNLLGNAWKFTSKTSRARIEFGRLDGPPPSAGVTPAAASGGVGAVYFVRDNGAGFDMQYANKLFGAFQRLHSTSEFPGTGIGLATVARIIHRHGGEVWAEGAVDQGATFYFTLQPGARPADNGDSSTPEEKK